MWDSMGYIKFCLHFLYTLKFEELELSVLPSALQLIYL